MLKIIDLQKKYSNKVPAFDLDVLLAAAIRRPRSFIMTHPEYQPNLIEKIRFYKFIFDHSRGFSIAAIVGHKEFFGLDFYVNKQVLIPRPDTEIMVEEAIAELKKSTKKTIMLDVGTGSGTVALSVATTLPTQAILATDISRHALRVAKINNHRFGTKVQFIQSNLLNKIKINDFKNFEKIILTANLPYLNHDQLKNEPSIKKEPRVALVADENGLALYRQLLKQIKVIFSDKKLCILLEIDPGQTNDITEIISQTLPSAKVEIKKDLSGLERLIKISV